MWTKAIINIAALLTIAAFISGTHLFAQDAGPAQPGRPTARPESIIRGEALIRRPPVELDCEQKMAQAYDSVLTYLNSTALPSPENLRKAALDASGIESQDLGVIPLGNESTPDFLVGCSCNVDVTNTRGSFRIFRAVDRGYIITTKSEDSPILLTTDDNGLSVDRGSLEVAPITSPALQAQSSFFATVWTRGGGRPAPFSVIVWEWNGSALRPIWSKLEVRNGTIDVSGAVIVLSNVRKGTEAPQSDVFRVSDGSVIYEGKLSDVLLRKYTDEKTIVPQSPAEYSRWAALWQSTGDIGQAITWYEKAITLSKDGEANYLYLTVADLYQGQGEFKKAARALQAYQRASKEQLTPQSNQELNERIRGLQRRREQ